MILIERRCIVKKQSWQLLFIRSLNMSERFSVMTTKEKLEKLDAIAKDQKRSRNNLINIIIDEYLENKK
jgi:hypothetical protein